jgi:diacylglycerol kinase (ATP)
VKKVAIIANAKHKRALKLKEELSGFLKEGFEITEKRTERGGHATELCFQAVNEGADYIIAAGGDGTMNEVVNGVMQVPTDKRDKVLVGLFPLGTGNDFARTAQLAKSAEGLADLIQNRQYQKIDVGHVEFLDENDTKKSRYFNNIAEIGVGAKTVEIVNKSKKTLGSTLTFVLGVLKAFIGYKQQEIKINADNFSWEGKIVAICVANGQYFGSGLGIAPGASLNDGKLSLVIVGSLKIVHFLWYMPKLRKLKKIKHPQVNYLKIDACEVIGKQKYPLEMDGENVGFTPFSAKVISNAINLLKP